ncbi:hypothetical protein RJ639_029054 [Escallonia herrerae]|uniref:Uncharacterized protein n=1 Tax=Escallonia herrerae TaxID=1293975 RepID=A0AA89BJU1_9ASTE|nr:hypothetical protein RJ639_029054 [Escallonia herrerae]
MSFFQPLLSSNSNFDEHRWVIQIRRALDEGIEEDVDVSVSIFCVPKSLMLSSPDSYVPQQVALGPFHHWRSELIDMERYKLGAAKRTQKQLQSLNFQHLVDHLTKLEPSIRASYHKYLDLRGETLAWMMAVDSSFLLEFLQVYAAKEDRLLRRVTSRMSHLVDISMRKSAHHAILRDMVMLENQIPLFLLRKTLEHRFSSLDLADDLLISMLTGLSKELSPFKMMEELSDLQVTDCAHVLGFLYRTIVPKLKELSEIDESTENQDEVNGGEDQSFRFKIRRLLSKLQDGPVRSLKQLILSRPLRLALKLPWTIVSNLPWLRLIKQPIDNLCFSQDKEESKSEIRSSNSSNNTDEPPLIEEISIPSISELSNAGVCFLPTNGGIFSINFDRQACTLYLPTVSLDVNTEVVMRNLVAYEACSASGPLVFTRYTELMNGMIDTEEDAKLLRERGIILNHLKSDEEVANLWNGMSKSLRLTKVPFLDEVIEDVNTYYNGLWKTKIGQFIKGYVFESWKFLALLAAVFLLLLMTLQAFCSVYSCPRRSRVKRFR